jgi:hypothetical protein
MRQVDKPRTELTGMYPPGFIRWCYWMCFFFHTYPACLKIGQLMKYKQLNAHSFLEVVHGWGGHDVEGIKTQSHVSGDPGLDAN